MHVYACLDITLCMYINSVAAKVVGAGGLELMEDVFLVVVYRGEKDSLKFYFYFLLLHLNGLLES